MVRDHLSEELIDSGLALLQAADSHGLRADGAMWLYDYQLEDWRLYLVTSLIDTVGRIRVYRHLISIFRALDLPENITVDDVHLGSPNDDLFRLVSSVAAIDNSIAHFKDCSFNGVKFDGVVYRSIRSAPSKAQAQAAQKTFSREARRLQAA